MQLFASESTHYYARRSRLTFCRSPLARVLSLPKGLEVVADGLPEGIWVAEGAQAPFPDREYCMFCFILFHFLGRHRDTFQEQAAQLCIV